VAESEPDALARSDARPRLDRIDRIDGNGRNLAENRGTKFGAGLDPRVLGRLVDYLATDFGRRG
jgi:hypothetical protein